MRCADDAGIHASLVDTTSTPMLLRLFESGQLDGSSLITHGLSLYISGLEAVTDSDSIPLLSSGESIRDLSHSGERKGHEDHN